MAVTTRSRRLSLAALFLAPNVLGFLAFTLVPLVASMVLAFTNWDLRLHNMFRHDEPLRFIWFQNFTRLLNEPNFWRFLGNTLFLMMGIPFGIGGSLVLAILLSRDFRGGNRRVLALVVATACLIVGLAVMLMMGLHATGMTLMLGGLACVVLLMGVAGGTGLYRTLLYLPSFTSGVATILLWKNLFKPEVGPINTVLAPMLDRLSGWVNKAPVVPHVLMWILIVLMVALGLWGVRKLWELLSEKESGSALMLAGVLLTLEAILLGLVVTLFYLPKWSLDGLQPPGWHTSYSWAKPAIMIIGFWAALGSNNMLLYLAGLSGIPQELYEAADIDGASPFQRFWNVTWPQLAPTTFFIVVLSVIGGLQGGFEIARTLTSGGPDGSTTTLSYFIYTEGFETGRLGYSSAVAWLMFVMVFLVTMFNWKFGNRYVND
jgi:multiple sugar transport system permease protein